MVWLLLRPWLAGLRKAGFEVHIACAKGKHFDQLSQVGFIMHPVRFRRSFNLFAHIIPFFQLIGILKAGQFQIVNTHSPVAAAVGRLAAAFARTDHIIYTVHGFYFHERMPAPLRYPLIALEWLFGRWTDAFMFVSDEDRRTAQQLGICGANAKVCTIYNGVDVDVYYPPPDSGPDALRAKHGIADRPVVGIVGRIVKEKGHREFLEMAGSITKSGIDATYLVVGDSLPSDRDHFGPEFRNQVGRANLSDSFVFTGMTDKVPEYLRLMDIFVLPSYREGFPRSILEAMATGLPVVATDIRGCREAVVNGETGYIVPPRDSGALTAAVESLLRDAARRKQMGSAARRLTCEKYDFRNVREQFVSFVTAIAEGRPAFMAAVPVVKLAATSAALLTLLITLLGLYVIPNLIGSLFVSYYKGAWAFILFGDILGCAVIALLLNGRWAFLLYCGLSGLEWICVRAGLWTLRQVIWFSNLIPTIVIGALLVPMLVAARNWRRPRTSSAGGIGLAGVHSQNDR